MFFKIICYLRYKLLVDIKDKGTPALTSSCYVIVIIDDVNDNPPSFTRLFSQKISEDTLVGDCVTKVYLLFVIKLAQINKYYLKTKTS